MAASNNGQMMLDLSGLGGIVGAAIKQSLATIQDSLTKLVNKPAPVSYDIAGLREQILENARFLYPIVISRTSINPNDHSPHEKVIPEMNVVTCSSGSEISANVLYDGTSENVHRLNFIQGPAAECAGQALEKLLAVTQRAIGDNLRNNVYGPEDSGWAGCGDYSGESGYFHYLPED